MRILFTFAGGSGHLDPLVPIAHAAEAAEHTVAFVGRPWMSHRVEAEGFTAFAAGSDVGLTPKRLPLQELDPERDDRELRDGFAGSIARERAADILVLCDAWRPDLIVWEETDFGAVIAAERLAIPHAAVLVIAAGSFLRKELIAEPMQELRADYGLAADPELTMLSRHLVLSPFPPSLRDAAFPLPATAHTIRPATLDDALDQTVPQWVADLPDAPTVYFTLGTVFNMECGDLYARVIQGLRDLPINLIVTVGQNIDPAELGPQPANVRIERYIRQSVLLPHCSLVISHGGSGSVAGALAHGLPSVLIPMGADQPRNAARCAEIGVSLVLDAVRATPEDVRVAVATVMADAAYRQAAERLRDEIADLPGAAFAVTLLERLVAATGPLLRAG